MSTFIALSKDIVTIEPYDPEGVDDVELPAGYGHIGGKKLKGNPSKLQLVTIMVSPGRIVKCPVDIDLMEFIEGQEVKIVMGGNKAVCLANITEKKYVYFNKPLRSKYTVPRVMAGVNMAMVVAVSGYIVALIMQHSQSKMGLMIVEGGAVLLFFAALAYSLYYYSNDEPAYNKLRHYLKKILN